MVALERGGDDAGRARRRCGLSDAAQTPDPTFRPRVLYAEGEIFNFGYVRIEPASDGTSRLYADIRDETGAVRVGSALELVAQ